jgi:hypothetical protein
MTPKENRPTKDPKAPAQAAPQKSSEKDASDLNADFAKFTKDMYVRQLELFQQWNGLLSHNMPTPDESTVLSNIVMEHIKQSTSQFETFMAQNAKPGPELVENQRRLMLDFIDNYNQMLKEIMATGQFASVVGQALSKGMEDQRNYEKARDQMAGQLGFPSKSDIRELHESIHFINKRLDEIERLVRKALREE